MFVPGHLSVVGVMLRFSGLENIYILGNMKERTNTGTYVLFGGIIYGQSRERSKIK